MLSIAVLFALLSPAQEPADRYRTLEREYQAALMESQKALAEAKTAEERQKASLAQQNRLSRLVGHFLALARESPRSPAAIDALTWVARNAPIDLEGDPRGAALEKLSTEHIGSEKLGPLCTQLVRSLDADSEKFLRLTLNRSPHKGVQARACMSLALDLKFRARVLQGILEDKELAKQYEAVWGKAVLARLRERKPEDLLQEAEKFLDRVKEKYADIPHPTFGNLGRLAYIVGRCVKAPVAVGKPVPEVRGEDLQGKPLKLSEYRGKVVLLDFWGSAFPASRASFPLEKALVKRLAGKPFVVLGVNSDGDREVARKLAEKEGLSWRSYWDGGSAGGPIATRFEVEFWPTLFLIDHKGVVRHLNVGWPTAAEVDEAIDSLIKEAEAAGKTDGRGKGR